MDLSEIIKDFILKTLLPVVLAYLIFEICKSDFIVDGQWNTTSCIIAIVICGMPFGLRRMRTWVIPTGAGDPATSAGILLFNFFVGGLLGVALLAWKFVLVPVYLVLTIVRLVQYFV